MSLPLAFTCGDPAGIGPEVAVAAAGDERVRAVCQPILIGSAASIDEAAGRLGVDVNSIAVRPVTSDGSAPLGKPTAAGGQIAYESLIAAIDGVTASKDYAGIVTAPLNKYSLQLAHREGRIDCPHPGHTEILAERAGAGEGFAMMLHVPHGRVARGPAGLSIAHVTLHTSVASVPGRLSVEGIAEAAALLDRYLPYLGCGRPRIAVAALNPHGGEGGLFGDEETRLIEPAVDLARRRLPHATIAGPLPCDTLIRRAMLGEFDGVVAMYHDQGHIPVKLVAFDEAINITLGLPLTRTSPTHGTAFDIVGRQPANAEGMVQAALTAARMIGNGLRPTGDRKSE